MVAEADIRSYCAAIAGAFKPDRIILFGSHAYGQPHRDSDVDVLVVLPKKNGGQTDLRWRFDAAFPQVFPWTFSFARRVSFGGASRRAIGCCARSSRRAG
jgi:predicted nucleotidyltransferase